MTVNIASRRCLTFKRVGVAPKCYSLRLTFALAEINVGDLAHFSKKKGVMIVELNQALPEPERRKKAAVGTNGEEIDEEEE